MIKFYDLVKWVDKIIIKNITYSIQRGTKKIIIGRNDDHGRFEVKNKHKTKNIDKKKISYRIINNSEYKTLNFF